MMKMHIKRLILFLTVFTGLFFSDENAEAHDKSDVTAKFAQAVWKNDKILAQTCLANGVKLPEIRENSPKKSYQLVRSPMNHVMVMLANFWDEELGGERLALIWELTVEDNKITRIRTVFDGANPLMDELRLIKDYQNLYQREVLMPSEFPFKITHFSGHIEYEHERLVLRYRNEYINSFLQIHIKPVTLGLERYQGKNNQLHTLKDGTKVLYRSKFDLGYEIRFHKEGMHYTVAIGNKKYLKKKFTVNDLIKIADSMK
ncbi:hypothetical protein [Cohnella terricola]|uniref:DUF4367 domain-containing protein n=1 Tax=Cohnella terricola TaxID=1289167 RepID=A0A559JQJ5_9BACL|nr:hypothetical protein [Cohnella terricola]TVY02154.1 hypothetical protein FPZ45_06850 [Cohnella terricola]